MDFESSTLIEVFLASFHGPTVDSLCTELPLYHILNGSQSFNEHFIKHTVVGFLTFIDNQAALKTEHKTDVLKSHNCFTIPSVAAHETGVMH